MPVDPSIISSYNPGPGIDVNALMQQRMQGMENINALERQRRADDLAMQDRAAAQKKAQEAEAIKALIPAYVHGINNPEDYDGMLALVPPGMQANLAPYIDQIRGLPPEQVRSLLTSSLLSSDIGKAFLENQARQKTYEVQLKQAETAAAREAREAAAGSKVAQWITDDAGNVTGLDAQGNVVATQPGIGRKTPPSATAAKVASPEAKFKVDETLSELMASYNKLKEEDAMVSTEDSTIGNIIARTGAAFGTTVGRAVGTKAQTERDYIQNLRSDLIRDIKQATGMSSQEINSNFELQSALDALGDPYSQSFETAVRTIAKLSRKYGLGGVGADIKDDKETSADGGAGAGAGGNIREGMTATNPQTGERVIYKDGRWQPL